MVIMKISSFALSLLILTYPAASLAETDFRETNRRLIEYEENLPYVYSIANIVCKEGRKLNLDYLPYISRIGYNALIGAVNIVAEGTPLPSYNAKTSGEKDLLSQIRAALVIKTMRKVCPDVW